MANKIQVYAVNYSNTVNPSGSPSLDVTLPIVMKEFKIRSFFWDWYARDTVTNLVFNKYNNTVLELAWTIGRVDYQPVALFAKTVPALITNNGDRFALHESGQFKFESFYFENDCIISLGGLNRSANSIALIVSAIMEIEII